jgi:UDP-GlcNAc:undecaprenyl-phosphate GlcNAc-1-phosphate transferase
MIGAFFGICAIIFSKSTLWGSIIVVGGLLLFIQLTAEVIGLMGNYKPLLNMVKKAKIITK